MSVESSLKKFGFLCRQVTEEPSLTIKEEILRGFFQRYIGDLGLLLRLLLPKHAERIYNAQEKQLLRVLSLVLSISEDTLKAEWNSNGCIGVTARKFFTPTVKAPLDKDGWCLMDLQTFDAYLNQMSAASNEVQRVACVCDFFACACPNAVYYFFRELKHDLRLGAGLRVVLAALHPNAYTLFQHCADVQEVVRRVKAGGTDASATATTATSIVAAATAANTTTGGALHPSRGGGGGAVRQGGVTAEIKLGLPLAPMLAAPARSIDQILTKCPNGAYSEVKYDGERIQIHHGKDKSLHCFARSLKPMRVDKFQDLVPYIQDAIQVDDCILDGEILMVDLSTSLPLPFGTLGKHKKAQFTTACTCVFLFDILYKDGESLLSRPLEERRALLKSSVKFIRNRVMYSELCLVTGDIMQRRAILQRHLTRAIAEGLEGLVVKDLKGVYEPRARHWLKIKKDYLNGLADSADLLVLGAWYGSGNKGGLLSTFLMGCVDEDVPPGLPGRYKTVCKVGNGLDDMAITLLSRKYSASMSAVANNGGGGAAPSWLSCHSSHMPDMLVKDPRTSDVMEIIGAEFSITKTHTSGVSIRFPRILRVRTDKIVDTATTNQELMKLFQTSKGRMIAAGIPDEAPLPLVDSYALVVEEDEEGRSNPLPMVPTVMRGDAASAAAPTVQKAPSTAKARQKQQQEAQLVHARGDMTLVASTGSATATPSVLADPSENILLCHCTAAAGQWSTRGVMGRISDRFGPTAARAYASQQTSRTLGDVVVAEVGDAARAGRVYVASMLAQQQLSSIGVVPQIDPTSLSKCISQCIQLAMQYDATIHFARPPPATGIVWSSVEAQLRAACVAHGMSVVWYEDNSSAPVVVSSEKIVAATLSSLPPPPSVGTVATRVDCDSHHSCQVQEEKSATVASFPPTRTHNTSSVSTGSKSREARHSGLLIMRGVHADIVGSDEGDDANRQELKLMIESCGGSAHVTPHSSAGAAQCGVDSKMCTHVIVLSRQVPGNGDEGDGEADHSGEPAALHNAVTAAPLLGSEETVYLVHSQWVVDCCRDAVRYPEEVYHPSRHAILAECRLFLSPTLSSQPYASSSSSSFSSFPFMLAPALHPNRKDEGCCGSAAVVNARCTVSPMERLALLLGATMHTSWKLIGKRTNYCIADSWGHEAVERVFALGGLVLCSQWLLDCAVAGKAVPVQPYVLTRDGSSSAHHRRRGGWEGKDAPPAGMNEDVEEHEEAKRLNGRDGDEDVEIDDDVSEVTTATWPGQGSTDRDEAEVEEGEEELQGNKEA